MFTVGAAGRDSCRKAHMLKEYVGNLAFFMISRLERKNRRPALGCFCEKTEIGRKMDFAKAFKPQTRGVKRIHDGRTGAAYRLPGPKGVGIPNYGSSVQAWIKYCQQPGVCGCDNQSFRYAYGF